MKIKREVRNEGILEIPREPVMLMKKQPFSEEMWKSNSSRKKSND
jgi:hypothetical protein